MQPPSTRVILSAAKDLSRTSGIHAYCLCRLVSLYSQMTTQKAPSMSGGAFYMIEMKKSDRNFKIGQLLSRVSLDVIMKEN